MFKNVQNIIVKHRAIRDMLATSTCVDFEKTTANNSYTSRWEAKWFQLFLRILLFTKARKVATGIQHLRMSLAANQAHFLKVIDRRP